MASQDDTELHWTHGELHRTILRDQDSPASKGTSLAVGPKPLTDVRDSGSSSTGSSGLVGWPIALAVICAGLLGYQILLSNRTTGIAAYISGLCIPTAVFIWALFQAIFLRRHRNARTQATALLCIYLSLFVGAIIGLSLRQQLMAGTLSNLSAPDIPIDADHKLQQASEDGLRGDFSSAVRLATEVIDQQPNNVMAYLLRGTAYRRNGEHLQAIADLDRAIELDSMSSLAYTQRAFSHQQNSTSGASKLILEDLHRAIELDASNALAHILRGNELAEAKQFDAAIADYDRAAQLNPRSFAALAGRASSKLGLGQLDEARRDLENALKLNPPVGDRRQIEALLQYAVSRSNTDDPDRDGTFVRRE